MKLLPIVVRVFDPEFGVANFKLSVTSIPNEKSSTVAELVKNEVESRKIADKLICFCADNTNLNFGGVNRNGRENVWRKLQEFYNRSLIGIGCGAHISHNAIDAGCEMLEINFEALAVTIHKHFKLHTVRNEALKTTCAEPGQVFEATKSHSGTRFLSLNPALQRVISMYEPLKQYFNSIPKCPPSIKRFFNDETGKFWLCFVQNQTSGFNTTVKKCKAPQLHRGRSQKK